MLHHFAIGRVLVNDGFERLQVGYFFIGIDAGREKTEPVGGHRGALVATALNDGAEIVAVAIGRGNHVPAIVHFEEDGIVFVGDCCLREIAFLAGFRIFLDEAHGAGRADIAKRGDYDGLFVLAAGEEMFFEDIGDLFLVSAHDHGVDHRENGFFAAEIGEGGKSGERVAIGHEIVEDAVEELVVGNEFRNVLLQDEESGAGEDVVDVLGVWIFGDALDFSDGDVLRGADLDCAEQAAFEGLAGGGWLRVEREDNYG